MCAISTRIRRIARSANDPNPIEQHDACCDQHPVLAGMADASGRADRCRSASGDGALWLWREREPAMTGRHTLAATSRSAWINECAAPRPPFIRTPQWLIRAWARIDHFIYLRRYGHAEGRRADGRLHAYYRAIRPTERSQR